MWSGPRWVPADIGMGNAQGESLKGVDSSGNKAAVTSLRPQQKRRGGAVTTRTRDLSLWREEFRIACGSAPAGATESR